MGRTGGYDEINQDLLDALKDINLTDAAHVLDLECDASGQIEMTFLGHRYRIGPGTVQRVDGQAVGVHHGSVLAGYILRQGRGEPAGRFVPLDRLTGMVGGRTSSSGSGLEFRLGQAAETSFARFQRAIRTFGGQPGGEVGEGGTSWIVNLLPNIPVQVIVYAGDDEFPANVQLLFDARATNFLEFEFLAVLASIFVEDVIQTM